LADYYIKLVVGSVSATNSVSSIALVYLES